MQCGETCRVTRRKRVEAERLPRRLRPAWSPFKNGWFGEKSFERGNDACRALYRTCKFRKFIWRERKMLLICQSKLGFCASALQDETADVLSPILSPQTNKLL